MVSIIEYFKNIFDLPLEVVCDYPLIMLAGNNEMFIENHKGIALYQEDLLKIRIKNGILTIEGHNINVKEINSEYLSIVGEFINFYFET